MRWRVAFGLILILLVLDSLLAGVSAASLSYSQSISFYGTIMNPTPTPTPTGPYSYIISVSGSNYQMTDGTTGQIVFQSTNSSQVFSNVVGNCSAGGSIDVKSGVYTVTATWLISGVNGITLNFENGAKLVAGNGLNSDVLWLSNSNNDLINGITIDGNAANQAPLSGKGITIAGSNDEVNNALIYDCSDFGVQTYRWAHSGSGYIQVTPTHSGVINSKIYNCGSNGVTFVNGSISCYLINSEIYGCSDVGASTCGVGTLITGNYIHDLNGTTGSGGNAKWGIAVEAGYNDVITGNTVLNCSVGIHVNQNNCTISDNTISNSTFGIELNGKEEGCSYNTVEDNYVGLAGSVGIFLTGATFNAIIGNHVSQSAYGGISVDGTSNNNTLSLNVAYDNGRLTDYSQVGIQILGSSNYISQNQAFDDRSGASRTQKYGISVYPDYSPTGNVLIGNNVYNNIYANIYDSNVPESTMINNIGYNPVGPIASPISGSTAYLVDSGSNSTWISGMVYTNTGSPKVLNISAGTVSVVAQNGVTLFTATGCTVTLQPGDTFSVTFSTAPTIKVTGQ